MRVSVSILGIKNDLSKIEEIEQSVADYIHLDIMDGEFVSNKVDMNYKLKKPLDIHLMVYDIASYIDRYKQLNPEYITFHIEATDCPKKIIEKLHSLNIKAGISISPNTMVSEIKEYLEIIDLVLVMTVVPGKGGQSLIPSTISKINQLEQLRKEFNYHYLIEADGGINNDNCHLLNNTDILVIGSQITNSDNYNIAIHEIKNSVNK